MEVLSVQNQFQGQFVIGSTKVKDWTSPLTSPPHHRQHHHHRNHRHHHNNTHYGNNAGGGGGGGSGNIKTTTEIVAANNSSSVDIVDGFTPRVDDYYHGPHAPTTTQKQQQQQLQQQQQQQHHEQQPQEQFRYNSNLICCGGNSITTGVDCDDIDAAAINELSMRLQSELRAAKSRHLACTEVSLPWDLTPRIAAEIIRLSEKEPCGIRGCTIYIEFEDEPSNTRRIASLKIDPNTVSTFELYLTLKHDKSGWTSLLPQFIKNLTRSSSIIISPDFSLTKNKLYHSSSE